MNKYEAVQYLRKRAGEIPHLSQLHYLNNEYPIWRRAITGVMEDVFGKDSSEYEMFSKTYESSGRNVATKQRDYRLVLRTRHNDIWGIIQKHETLGFDNLERTVPAPKIPYTDLFDALQLHPKVIEASRELYRNGHYAPAIFEAFKAVNNFVKRKTAGKGLGRLSEKQLMSKVFDPDEPIIKLNELTSPSDRDEQEGYKFLFMGATVGIRNPKAHDPIVQDNPYTTLKLLCFASILIQKIDFWKSSKG